MANEVAVIEKTEIATFQNDGASAIDKAKELARSIVDAETLNAAAKFMLEAKSRIKKIKERFTGTQEDPGPKTLAKLAWQKMVDMETGLIEPYERIETEILKPAIKAFNDEQDRKRRQEEDRQRAEAKKREEDRKLAEAQELHDSGEKEMAQAKLEEEVYVPPVIIPKAAAPAGISYRDSWQFEIVDPKLIPSEYLAIDEKKIGGVVRTLKGETRIAGVRVWCEKIVAGRA